MKKILREKSKITLEFVVNVDKKKTHTHSEAFNQSMEPSFSCTVYQSYHLQNRQLLSLEAVRMASPA